MSSRAGFEHSGFDFVIPPLAKVPMIEKLGGVLIAVRRLQREGWNADVVHAHEFIADRPAALASALMRAPLVMSEHASALALGELSADALGYARRAFRRADVVCAASRSLAQRIAPLAGTTPVCVVSSPVIRGFPALGTT